MFIPSYKKPGGGGGGLEIVTWAGGTDEQIVAMVEAHYNGDIDLTEYWTVGDERTVSLSAMSATGVGESHVAQDVVMTLMNVGGKELSTSINGHTECVFIVGQKNVLTNPLDSSVSAVENGYMNSANASYDSWDACERRTWCNNIYYNAIPATLRPIFKQHINRTYKVNSTTKYVNSVDYFALPAEKEVFGSVNYSNDFYEGSYLTKFSYYTSSATRKKYAGSYQKSWWLRSPVDNDYNNFCSVSSSGSQSYNGANYIQGISPFGVI